MDRTKFQQKKIAKAITRALTKSVRQSKSRAYFALKVYKQYLLNVLNVHLNILFLAGFTPGILDTFAANVPLFLLNSYFSYIYRYYYTHEQLYFYVLRQQKLLVM